MSSRLLVAKRDSHSCAALQFFSVFFESFPVFSLFRSPSDLGSSLRVITHRSAPLQTIMSTVCQACSKTVQARGELTLCTGPCSRPVHVKCTAKGPGGNVCAKCKGLPSVKPTVAILSEWISLLTELLLKISQDLEQANLRINELSSRPVPPPVQLKSVVAATPCQCTKL